MTIFSMISTFILSMPLRRRRHNYVRLLAYAAYCWSFAAVAASADPVIINQPFTANPGDVISLGGSGFGTAPQVFLKASHQAAAITLATKTADDGTVVVAAPRTIPFDLYEVWIANGSATSPHIYLNAPKPLHFDNAEIAPGAHVRIFGRNLYVNGLVPTATFIDQQTNATLKAAVNLPTSSPYVLDVQPPLGVIAGHSYKVSVFNGYATALLDDSIQGHAPGIDHFLIGQPWAYDFVYQDGPGYQAGTTGTNQADHHFFNVKTDPSLGILAKGDGVASDGAAIQGAINKAAAYGGVVYLPAGTYNLGSIRIDLKPGVVLQGQSSFLTKITFGPAAPAGFIVDTGGMSGFADLTIQNVDLSSNPITNIGTWGRPISRFFIQRVVWNLGSGAPIYLTGDRVAILNSIFTQGVNYQNGSVAQKTGGVGPLYFSQLSNLHFLNNIVKWSTDQNSMNDLVNAVIENNHFTRGATDTLIAGPAQASWSWPYINQPVRAGQKVARVMGRQLTINFGKNIVVQNNLFDVSDGVILTNHNDGETILNEAGGQNVRQDWGTVTAVDSQSVTDNSKCSGTCAWKIYPNSMAVIVSGAGAGQWRHIMAQNNNTFTLDKPFDVVPAPGDHFSITAPAYENALISNNTATGNPVGIAMYHGAYLNVSVIGNQLTNNGGIYLVSHEQLSTSFTEPAFDTAANLEIKGNVLTDTSGVFPSYIALNFVMINNADFWGKSVLSAEIRNNRISARASGLYYFFHEGYQAYTSFQNYGGQVYNDQHQGAIIGAVFQGNSCINCPADYTLSTGIVNATIWNALNVAWPGVASKCLADLTMTNSSQTASVGTVVGND
ncbi:conserved exported hypothetical protein [Methylocella tundrae]|uniref:Rhamnogalacturonase A/B/Epimerase-like pectate lyase domain-containing protein n=1 Tax=Methylocella tundrae TaxID=227605 RepID=A0A8B6M2Z2_METTU|nr:glycosyl hydrolase family 28-related protein [Methylocella tundrae]VTZ49397.1 conserved exported hypothetical protein [Methylocella tundrae]